MKPLNIFLSGICRVMTMRSLVLLFCLYFPFSFGIQAQEKSIKEQIEELRLKKVNQNKLLSQEPVYIEKKDSIEQKTQAEDQTTTPKASVNESKHPVNDNQELQTIILKQDSLYEYIKEKKWSLEECIQYAIDHNISIKQLELQKKDTEIQNSTAKYSRLPDLNASTGQEWDFYKISYDTVYNNKSRSVSSFELSSSIPLFTGFRIPNEIARTKLEIQAVSENLAKAKEDLSLNITSLFLQVLFYKELLSIDDNQLELSKNQVKRTELLVKAGSVPKSQLYDIYAQVAKDEFALVEAKNNLDLALIDLAQALELEKNLGFDIYAPEFEGDIINQFIGSIAPPDQIYEGAVIVKPGIKGQEYKVESAEKSLKIVEAGYLPQLDLLLSAGTNYLYLYNPETRLSPLTQSPLEENDSFSNQLKNNNNRIIGLKLTIPIFNRFSVKNNVKRAKIDIQNQQLILENAKKSLYKEIQIAYKNSTASIEKYRSSEKSVQAASLAFNYAQKRYELGNSSVFEFNEAKTRYIQSQSELVQSKYEYILRVKILDFYMGVPINL
ncbi:MAG: TolC family protein [Candidatus Symbiothrix sp.]|jgi:outer membrane protein|nr:TolC family protein [Candidatus Symbiothrix sp.]